MSTPLVIKEQKYEWQNFMCQWFEWIVESTCPTCGKKYKTDCTGTLGDACSYDYPCRVCEPEEN
jgi:hypothetical protein